MIGAHAQITNIIFLANYLLFYYGINTSIMKIVSGQVVPLHI